MTINFSYPLEAPYTITQYFGENADWYLEQLGLKGGHLGLDFLGHYDTPGGFCAPGKIIFAGIDPSGDKYKGGFGNMIKVQHEGGYVSLYAHLRNYYVMPGDEVRSGIYEYYTTGFSGFVYPAGPPGSHLHFGLYLNGVAIDPLPLLQGEIVQPEPETPAPEDKTHGYARIVGSPYLPVRGLPSRNSPQRTKLFPGMANYVYETRSINGNVWALLTDTGDLWAAMCYNGYVLMEWI